MQFGLPIIFFLILADYESMTHKFTYLSKYESLVKNAFDFEKYKQKHRYYILWTFEVNKGGGAD